MKLSLNYKEILEETLKSELTWYLEEFEQLFDDKSTYTKQDVLLANELLLSLKNNLTEPCKLNQMQNLLTNTIDRIGSKYPNLF